MVIVNFRHIKTLKMKAIYLLTALILLALTWAAEEVCQTEVCKKFAADLQQNSMKPSAAPCDDFYEYICGNYPAHHVLDHELEWSNSLITRQRLSLSEIDEALLKPTNSSSKVIQFVSQLYSQCVDTATWEKRGVTPLIDIAEQVLGAFPLIRKPKTATSKAPQWPTIYADAYSKLGLRRIIDIDKSSYSKEMFFQAGPISLNPSNNYDPGKHISNQTVVEHYRTFLHQMVDILGSSSSKEKVSADIEALIHFEQQIEKISSETFSHQKDLEGTLDDLKIATGNTVDWRLMMNRILDNFNSTEARFTPTTKIESYDVPFIRPVTELLNTTPIEVIQNFYGIVLVLTYGPLTTKKLNDAIFAFNRDPDVHAFPASCGWLLNRWPMALGRVYVDTHFSAHEKSDATRLVSEIRASFRASLQSNSWLDPTTKKFAIQKLDAIKEEIGYPEWILNDTELDELYPDLKDAHLEPGFLEKMVNLQTIQLFKQQFEDIPLNLSRAHQSIPPNTVNAFYNPTKNAIAIPAGILQPPFFDHELPWALNYGAIGSAIGHELTHGFDSRGSQYDEHGTEKNWWSAETLVKFQNRTACLRDQYGAIHVPIADLNINGTRTLGENIADNGGVKEAFAAYKSHLAKKQSDALKLPGLNFTSDQLFFVGFANVWCEAMSAKQLKKQIQSNVHSPGRYRVNVVFGNTPQFAEAFKCPIGSKMNPVKKCAVW